MPDMGRVYEARRQGLYAPYQEGAMKVSKELILWSVFAGLLTSVWVVFSLIS